MSVNLMKRWLKSNGSESVHDKENNTHKKNAKHKEINKNKDKQSVKDNTRTDLKKHGLVNLKKIEQKIQRKVNQTEENVEEKVSATATEEESVGEKVSATEEESIGEEVSATKEGNVGEKVSATEEKSVGEKVSATEEESIGEKVSATGEENVVEKRSVTVAEEGTDGFKKDGNVSVERGKFAFYQWKADPIFKDWIEVLINGKYRILKCKYCGSTLNPRRSILIAHMNTDKHKHSVLSSVMSRQSQNYFSEKVPDKVKLAEIKISIFAACHTSLNVVPHLTQIYKYISGDSTIAQNLRLSRTKCTSIIKNLITPFFIKYLRHDVGDSPYSLLLDESTDISVQKYLGIIIRYFSQEKRQVVSTFLNLAPLESGTADAIVAAVKKTLNDFQLPISELCGIGCDNASVMIGKHNSVYTKLKSESPNLILIPCVCHSLQLSVSAAAKECLPQEVEYLISETYNWFSNSHTRQTDYHKLFNLINDDKNPKKLIQPCKTRWMSIFYAAERVSQQWLELTTHFQLAKTKEKCFKANILYDLYSRKDILIYVQFLNFVLGEVTRVNSFFQKDNIDMTLIVDDLLLLLKFVVDIFIEEQYLANFDLCNSPFEKSYFRQMPKLGYNALQEFKHLSSDIQEVVKTNCVNFSIHLAEQLRQRLPPNLKVFKHISWLNAKNIFTKKAESESNFIQLVGLYEKTTSKVTELCKQFDKLHLINWKNTNDSVQFWGDVYFYVDSVGNKPFLNISKFALKFLVLPFSNAHVERLFSQMNIVKTKLRNRMGLQLLSSILLIKSWLRVNKQCCENYEINPEMIKHMGKEMYKEDEDDFKFIEEILREIEND